MTKTATDVANDFEAERAKLARGLVAERDALKAVLSEIVHEYDDTYDAECDPGGHWTAAASIPVEVMERARKLVKP